MSVRAHLGLAYWLGPWTHDEGVPPGVATEDVSVPPSPSASRPMRARIYRPTRRTAEGSLLMVQGLHYLGADDPRMDRFARIVAASGVVVVAPFLPDFAVLRVVPALIDDTRRAFDYLEALGDRPPGRPGVFSISYGSMPALRLVADPAYADRVGGLCTFGGYANFKDTIRFCLLGGDGLEHDPLNRPALFLNGMDYLDGVPDDREPLDTAWQRFIHETWGRPEMKEPARFEAVARRLAEELPEEQRELYLMGCHAAPGGAEVGAAIVERAGHDWDYLDPRSHLSTLRCPVRVIHGRDDDVIPYTQAQKIIDALPPSVDAQLWLTGLYAHTGSAGLRHLIQDLPVLYGEMRSMLGILLAIRGVATGF